MVRGRTEKKGTQEHMSTSFSAVPLGRAPAWRKWGSGRKKTLALMALMAVLAGIAFRVDAGTFPVGVGPVSINMNLTDKNDGWFDTGLKLVGGQSFAVPELPRGGTGTAGG